MIRTVRLNAYQSQARAQEEANGLKLAFANSDISHRQGFSVVAFPYQGEFIVSLSADIETSQDGFLSLIVARVLASHCRAPVEKPVSRLPTQVQSISARALAARQPRLPYRKWGK